MTKDQPGMIAFPHARLCSLLSICLDRVRLEDVLLLNDAFRIDFSLHVMCMQKLVSKMSVRLS